MASIAFRIFAWGLLLAIFLFTDAPIIFRPVTHLSPNFERFAALCVVGLAFALAYPRRLFLVFCLLFFAIAIFELLQLMLPDRHAHFQDALFKQAGALAGISIGYVVCRFCGRIRPSTRLERTEAKIDRKM
jgi:VanZ family protein